MWRLVEGLISPSMELGSFFIVGLNVAFRQLCQKSVHMSMRSKSSIQSEHPPVRYFNHPSQISLRAATL